MRNAKSQVMDNLPQISDTQSEKALECLQTSSAEKEIAIKQEGDSLHNKKITTACPKLSPASIGKELPADQSTETLNLPTKPRLSEDTKIHNNMLGGSSLHLKSATIASFDKGKTPHISVEIPHKTIGALKLTAPVTIKGEPSMKDRVIKNEIIEKSPLKPSETEAMTSIAPNPLSFTSTTYSGEVAALGNVLSHPSGKLKPSLKDVLYSSNSSQPTFPVVFSERRGSKQGSNFTNLSSANSSVPFSDSFLHPTASQNNMPMSIALPLPLVARQTNEPQFIKTHPGGMSKGLHNLPSSLNQGYANLSSARPPMLYNRFTHDLESKRDSPSFDSLENDEDFSCSPRKSKRPRKYIRSGKYSKIKSKGSEGEYSPCPSSAPWTPAPTQNPTASSSEHPTISSNKSYVSLKSEQEVQHHRHIIEKINQSLKSDEAMVATPDLSRPFEGLEDAFDRLIPYHVFQYPDESATKVSEADFNAAKIISSYRSFKSHMSTLATRLRNEEKCILPLSVLIDHLLVKDAPSTKVASPNPIANGKSSTVPITPRPERPSSAALSEPSNE